MSDVSEITTGGRQPTTIPEEELLALLLDAGREKGVASDAVVDIVAEALQSGRAVNDILDDADVLSRRQRESLHRLVTESRTSRVRRSTLAGGATASVPAGPPVSAAERRRQDRDAEFRRDRDELLPVGEDRYDTVEEVGRGGWGVVVKATDLQLDRAVAVKKLSPAASRDTDMARRFLHEASITARLQHPGIVPVYERGVGLTDRQPFYAMKLLNGETLQQKIRRYHDTPPGTARRRQFHQLLKSFVDVCHAVSYAHASRIIHRDLKPANIIVGEFGETIVVDWGLARDLNESDDQAGEPVSEATLPAGTPLPQAAGKSTRLGGLLNPAVTQEGSVVGTPAYMPPEQARGHRADFAPTSDTYSLGVVLYVLLTGQLPFHGDDVETTLQQVMRGDYRHPRAVDRHVPAALASICVKAMSLAPEKRYQHAGELGDDVARFLACERVSAHRDRWLDKVSRWCRRHATMAVSMLVGAVTLAVVSTVAMILIQRAHRAEVKARQAAVAAHEQELAARQTAEAARADALDRLRKSRAAADTWLIGLSGALERFPGMQTVRRDLITEALTHYQELQNSVADDPQLALESARCLLRIGDLHLLLHEQEPARTAFIQAADLLPAINVAASRADVVREQLNCETGLLLVRLETDHVTADDCQALSTAASLLETSGTRTVEDSLATARAFLVAGRGFESLQQWPQAEQNFQLATTAIRQPTSPQESGRTQTLLATIRQDRARVLTLLGDHQQAATTLQRAVEATTARIDDNHERPDLLEDRAITRMKWANAQQRMGADWAAETGYRAAVQDLSHSWQLMFGDHFYSENLAIAQANLGQLAVRLNQLEDAEQMLRSAIEQLTGLLEDGQADRNTVSRLAACNVALGQVLLQTGNEAATTQIPRSIQIFEYLQTESELSPADHLAHAAAVGHLARAHRLAGDLSSAKTAARQAHAIHHEAIVHLQQSRRSPESVQRLQLSAAVLQLEFPAAFGPDQEAAAWHQLQQLAASEPADKRRRPQSATWHLLRGWLESTDATQWKQASEFLHTMDCSSAPDLLQLDAIANHRQQNHDAALESIQRVLRQRRFPLPVDYAIAARLANAAGQSARAAEYERQARTELAETPGDLRLRFWLEESLQPTLPLQSIPAGPTQ